MVPEPRLEIQRLPDPGALSRAAAGLVARLARQAVAERGRFTIALSGGSTPKRLFEQLARPPLRDRVPWDRIELFWGDERAVPPDHAEANVKMARAALLDHVPVASGQIHRMPAEREDLDAAAGDHQREIAGVFGLDPEGPPPVLDLVLLGMGGDGHTASLFPHTAALEPQGRWVLANDVPAVGGRRMTMTPAILNRARCVVFLVTGGEKAARLAEVLEGPHDPETLPSQLIRPCPGRLMWLIDRPAAAALRGLAARRVRLAPSILSADFARLGDAVAEAERAGADRIHVDVMDGHFVPNISIGPVVVRSLRPVTALRLETHLMITDPGRYAEAFAEAGSDSILFHRERAADAPALAERIRELGSSPGIVLNPGTRAEGLEAIIPHVDLVLAMTVHPGFGGQAFIEEMLGKITEVRKMIDRAHPACDLEVDGGIGPATARRAVEAGARVLVAGSAVFGDERGITAAMKTLRVAAGAGAPAAAAV